MKTTHNRKAKKITSRFDRSRDVNTKRIINTLEQRLANANKFVSELQKMSFDTRGFLIYKNNQNQPMFSSILESRMASNMTIERIVF